MFLKKKAFYIPIAILLVVALALGVWMVYSHFFSPAAQVRRELLKAMPLGTIMDYDSSDGGIEDSGWRALTPGYIVDLEDGNSFVMKTVITDLSEEEEEKNGLSNTYRVFLTFRNLVLVDIDVDEVDPDSINLFQRDKKFIKKWVKKQLPVGSDKAAVRAWLTEQTELDTEEIDSGYSVSNDHTLKYLERPEDPTVGVTSITAHTSFEYFFDTDVYIYFGFDENDRLVDVGVKASTDFSY